MLGKYTYMLYVQCIQRYGTVYISVRMVKPYFCRLSGLMSVHDCCLPIPGPQNQWFPSNSCTIHHNPHHRGYIKNNEQRINNKQQTTKATKQQQTQKQKHIKQQGKPRKQSNEPSKQPTNTIRFHMFPGTVQSFSVHGLRALGAGLTSAPKSQLVYTQRLSNESPSCYNAPIWA